MTSVKTPNPQHLPIKFLTDLYLQSPFRPRHILSHELTFMSELKDWRNPFPF